MWTRACRRGLAVVLLGLFGGCPASSARPGGEPSSTLIRGERESSGPLKASAVRPRPGAEPDQNPLEGDRLGLDEASARARRTHAEGHSAAGLALEEFSHPACAGLPRAERRACPLSSIHWSSARDIAGGVELETTDRGVEPTRLRWQFLCHLAFARAHGSEGCPLAVPGIEVTVLQIDGRTRLRLLTEERDQVSALRSGLRRLVHP